MFDNLRNQCPGGDVPLLVFKLPLLFRTLAVCEIPCCLKKYPGKHSKNCPWMRCYVFKRLWKKLPVAVVQRTLVNCLTCQLVVECNFIIPGFIWCREHGSFEKWTSEKCIVLQYCWQVTCKVVVAINFTRTDCILLTSWSSCQCK